MKKLALILALIIIPCSAFGLEMLNDSTMDGITGQSGVTIAFDDIQLFINIDTMAYIDCDGLRTFTGVNCNAPGGAVGISNFQIDVLNINAIVSSTTTDHDGSTGAGHSTIQDPGIATGAMSLYSVPCGDIPLFYNYGNTSPISGCYLGAALTAVGVTTSGGAMKGIQNYTTINTAGLTNGFAAQALTIDVTDKLPATSAGWSNNYAGSAVFNGVNDGGLTHSLSQLSVGGVYITLPTCEIYINSMILTPFYTGNIGTASSHAANDIANAYLALGETANFGTFEMDGITLTVLSGWLEISPH